MPNFATGPKINMNTTKLLDRALNGGFLTKQEGVFLFENAPTSVLVNVANEMRKQQVPQGKVTWIIDRNANTTNVCVANCKFCNFFVPPGHIDKYVTTIDEYKEKIDETFRYGGEQLLLQGGRILFIHRIDGNGYALLYQVKDIEDFGLDVHSQQGGQHQVHQMYHLLMWLLWDRHRLKFNCPVNSDRFKNSLACLCRSQTGKSVVKKK